MTLFKRPRAVHFERLRPDSTKETLIEFERVGLGTLAVILNGVLDYVFSSEPAIGIQPDFTVPEGERWKIRTISVGLISDATVVIRTAWLIIGRGGTQAFQIVAGANQNASESRTYVWGAGFPKDSAFNAANNHLLVPFPNEFSVKAGDLIQVRANNFQVGDSWTAIRLWVERFPDFTIP